MTSRARGAEAEERAADLLRRAGYRIVERNWRCRGGEIDIVARDGRTLCFVEVRLRTSATHGSAAATVSAAKQRRLIYAARAYLMTHRLRPDACRFDVVALGAPTGDPPAVIRGAFSAPAGLA